MPKVSVIMGVYNGAKRITNAVNSLLNQSFSDFEIIICDDGSTDNTYDVVKKLTEIDNRIILIKNNRNQGLATSLNNCLNIASGDFIARMDDDDISHPTRFEKQVDFLNEHPEYALVGTSRNFYDDAGVWGRMVVEGEPSKLDIFLGKSFAHPTVMMRKEALIDVGGYTTKGVGRTEDYDLWCKFYAKGYKGYNMSEVLLDYYQSRQSYSKRKYKYRINEFKLRKKWRKELNLPFKYDIHTYKPLFVGLIPAVLMNKYHKNKFSKGS